MKKNNLYTPLFIFLSIAIGLLLGRLIYHDRGGSNIDLTKSDKISALINVVHSQYVDSVSTSEIIEKIIPKVLQQLDPHSVYIPAVKYEETTAPLHGSFDGIGVQFNIQKDTIMIVSVIAGGPSEKEGLLAGDRIVTIDDSTFAGIGITNADVMKNLKGKKGSKVVLGIKRSGRKDLIQIEITRDKIPLYSVETSYMVNENTGYIRVSRFARTTHDEFVSAVKSLKKEGLEKIILDLRGNSGGYLGEAYKIVDEFLDDGKMIVYTEGKAYERENYTSTKGGLCTEMELIVLIDTWSASASEIVAGAIQDNDRGLIIGRRSFGKGLVQTEFEFRDGSYIRLTIARYYTPTGRCIQKPYSDNFDDYEHEIYNRLMNGELENQDSTSFADSLKYRTPEGRVVYGGGGIMPDIFIPIDTTRYSKFYQTVSDKNLIYNFAIEYTDKKRTALTKFENHTQIEKYLENQGVYSQFVNFTKTHKIKSEQLEIDNAKERIKTLLYAYIVRNVLDENNFYKVFNRSDKIYLRAVEEMK